MLSAHTTSNDSSDSEQAPKEQLFSSWLSGMVPMLSVPDADDSEESRDFFYGNDLKGRWRSAETSRDGYELLVHTETHGRTEWEAALLQSGSRRWVLTCLHELTEGLIRYRLVDEESGWWITLKEEVPVEERFDRDLSSSSRVGVLYNRYLKSPYSLELDWKHGRKVEVDALYEDAVLSVISPMVIAVMGKESQAHSFSSSVPSALHQTLGDLVAMLNSGSSRILMRFEKPIRLLMRVLEETVPSQSSSAAEWAFELEHDVVYKEVGTPLDSITTDFVGGFESIDEELLTFCR